MLNDSIFEKINKRYPKICAYNFRGQIPHGEDIKILKKAQFALEFFREGPIPKNPTISMYFFEMALRIHLPLLGFSTTQSFLQKGLIRGRQQNESAVEAIYDFFSGKNKEWTILMDEIFSNRDTCNILELLGKTIPLLESSPYECYFASILDSIRGARGEKFFKTVYRAFRNQTRVTELKGIHKRLVKMKHTNLYDDDGSAFDEFFDKFFLISTLRLLIISKFS